MHGAKRAAAFAALGSGRCRSVLASGVAVTALALAIRLAIAPAGVLTPDGARDLAAAARLAAAPNLVSSGPLIGNTIAGSPLYYYLLALPLAVFHSATAALVWLAALTALAVPFAWWLGCVLLGRAGGVVLASLIGADYWQLFTAMSHSAVDLLPLGVIALLGATAAAHVRRSVAAAFWAPMAAALAVQVHPVAVTLAPLLILCLGTRQQRPAFAWGSLAAAIVGIPWLVSTLGEAPHTTAGATVLADVPRAAAEGFADLGLLARVFVAMPGELARLWSQAVEPAAGRLMGMVVVAAVPALALVGLAVWALRSPGRPLGFVLLWIVSFVVLFPPLWGLAKLGYGNPGRAPTWYYFFPLEPLLPVGIAALFGTACSGTRSWLHGAGKFGLAVAVVVPATLAVCSFRSLASRGWLDVVGYSQLPDASRVPYLTVSLNEAAVRFVAAERGTFPDRAVHGLLLGSYVQSGGVLARLEGIPVVTATDADTRYALLWSTALPSPPDALARQILGPFTVFRFRSLFESATLRYSPNDGEAAWQMPGFDDGSWTLLSVPTLDRTPDASIYPPGPYRDWAAPIVRIRGRVRLGPGVRGLLGVGCAARDVGLDRITVRGAFLDGTPFSAPVWRSATLELYALAGGAVARSHVVALDIAVSPHAVLDLFAFGLEAPTHE
jgi:hypothetical protein